MPRGGPEGEILGDVFSRVGGVFIGIGAFRRYDVPVRLETLRQRCTCAQAAGDFLAFRVADERRKCCAGEPAGRAERYQLEAGGVTAAADGEAVLDGVFRVGGHPELRGKHRKAQLGFLAAVHCERDHRAGLHAALHHGLLSDPGEGQAVGCCHGAVRECADVGALLAYAAVVPGDIHERWPQGYDCRRADLHRAQQRQQAQRQTHPSFAPHHMVHILSPACRPLDSGAVSSIIVV